MGRPTDTQYVEALTPLRRGGGGKRVKLFSDVFPYLLIPVIIYNLIALFSGGEAADGTSAMGAAMSSAAMTLPMLSGVLLEITWGDLLVISSTLFLFIEVIKSTSTGSAGITNHILSMLLFVFCLMEFLMYSACATGTFFIITCIVLVDALAGMVVTIISARRDFGVEGQG
jgi:hypothetical protein